ASRERVPGGRSQHRGRAMTAHEAARDQPVGARERGALPGTLQLLVLLPHAIETHDGANRQKPDGPPVAADARGPALDRLAGGDLEDLARERVVPSVVDRRVGVP